MDYANPYLYQSRNYNINPYQQAANQNNTFVLVQGENVVKSWYVMPGTTVALCDTEAKVIYVKSADNMGQVTTTILDYKKRGEEPIALATPDYIVKSDLEDIYAQLKDLRDDLDGLSIKKSTKKKEVDE